MMEKLIQDFVRLTGIQPRDYSVQRTVRMRRGPKNAVVECVSGSRKITCAVEGEFKTVTLDQQYVVVGH
jgi:hypothetical protein